MKALIARGAAYQLQVTAECCSEEITVEPGHALTNCSIVEWIVRECATDLEDDVFEESVGTDIPAQSLDLG